MHLFIYLFVLFTNYVSSLEMINKVVSCHNICSCCLQCICSNVISYNASACWYWWGDFL